MQEIKSNTSQSKHKVGKKKNTILEHKSMTTHEYNISTLTQVHNKALIYENTNVKIPHFY